MTNLSVVEGDLRAKRNEALFSPCASIPGLPWLCAYTKPQRELHVEHQLRREGAAVWLPMEPATVRPHRGQPYQTHRPIFPRYLFLQMTGERVRWGYVIRNAAGEELGAVMRDPSGKPLAVAVGALETLWADCAPNGVIYPKRPHEAQPGDHARVLAGPFADLVGIVERTERERVEVMLAILGGAPVWLRRTQLEVV